MTSYTRRGHVRTKTGLVIGGAYERRAVMGSEAERIQSVLLQSHIIGAAGAMRKLTERRTRPLSLFTRLLRALRMRISLRT